MMFAYYKMIEKYNFHWKKNFFYNFPKRRMLFNELIKEIESKQINRFIATIISN